MASRHILPWKSWSFFICVVISCRVQGVLKIVAPLPRHKVVIQNETLRVTCVAFDEENKNVFPSGVDFFRVDEKLGITIPIKDQGSQGSYVFRNRTEVNGRKLYVTMVIERIKSSDSGQYRCKITNTTSDYGFGITYIAKSDLPVIKVSDNVTVKLGESVRLECNISQYGNKYNVKLVTIAWLKGDIRIAEVPPSESKLKDLTLTINQSRDGGLYKCELTTVLLDERTYNITGIIHVQVRPTFGAVKTEIIRIKGQAVEFRCNITGNPIKIVWKRRPRNKKHKIILDEKSYSNESNETRYKISSTNKYEGFKLEIPETDYEDRGDYYCCIRSSNSSVPDQCHRFTLRVKDPLRHLWPVLGIIVEVILLYVIYHHML